MQAWLPVQQNSQVEKLMLTYFCLTNSGMWDTSSSLQHFITSGVVFSKAAAQFLMAHGFKTYAAAYGHFLRTPEW